MAAVAWLGASALFVFLRVAVALDAQVGGAELVHLSGAWQARVGVDDGRFIPTLFQALTAALLHATTSEVPARFMAVAASATIPFALFLLRPHLGNAGALLALVLLALDAPGMILGGTATAMGFDLAVAAWLVVLVLRFGNFAPAWGAAAFFVATGGALVLPAALAAVVTWRRPANDDDGRPAWLPYAWAMLGLAAGVFAATFRFGIGPDGLRVPPFDALAAGADQAWSTATAGDVLVIYSLPLLLGGAAACAWILAGRGRGWAWPAPPMLLWWAAFAAAWLVASLDTSNYEPVAALNFPLALLAGPALVAAIAAMVRAEWRLARAVVPAALAFAAVAVGYVLDWAERQRVGDAGEQAQVALFSVAAVALLLVLARRPAAPALFAPALVLLTLPYCAGAFSAAFAVAEEPVPSPISTGQARDLRGLALSAVAGKGGTIAIHPSLRDAATWPFRDSGVIVIASRAPSDATVLVWPRDADPPAGFEALAGNWALTRRVIPPTNDVLSLLHWLIDRSTLTVMPDSVAVYVRSAR